MHDLPQVIADGPLAENVLELLAGKVQLLPWDAFGSKQAEAVRGVYTYGHPHLDGAMMDRLGKLQVISNCGVGVDHIVVADAHARGVPVGNTPDILNGATADMAFALLMAAGRRLVEGDRYARSADFTAYDPGHMLGREIHSQVLGILGMGRVGREVAQRGLGFGMRVLYHNRNEQPAAPESVEYVTFERLLTESDYLVLSLPLVAETRHIVGAKELGKMKRTATLVNVARGAVVDTTALTKALARKEIYAAGLDVTDPEPLPRDHPLLALENVVITPHLGSATHQTRQRMAEISCANLLAGLAGEPLLHRVSPA